MNTCFLFAEHLNTENCLCLCLDDAGEIIVELAVREIEAIKQLQESAKTYVVMSSANVGIHTIQLPLLASTKARPAITFALEEQLAEPVNGLHFAFDKAHYLAGEYVVAVCSKVILADLQQQLSALELDYDVITCDWFALNIGEACVLQNYFLVYEVDFKGALSLDLWDKYLNQHSEYSHIFTFPDSPSLSNQQQFNQKTIASYTWIAEQLFRHKPINFCQGEFMHTTLRDSAQKYYKLAAGLAAVWLSVALISKIVLIILLNRDLAAYDSKIAVIYKKFFPGAKQVITPRFRVQRLLQKNQNGYQAPIWKLLSKFAAALKEFLPSANGLESDKLSAVAVKQMQLQDNALILTISCSDFEVLEKVIASLQRQALQVKKTNAANKGARVVATLELR